MTTEAKRLADRLSQRKRRLREDAKAIDRAGSARRRQDPAYVKKEKQVTYEKALDLKNWPTLILYDIRCRAKRKNILFDLVAEDLVVPEICPVLGIKLSSGAGLGKNCRGRAESPSVDRFDNNKGYTKDNVRVISLRANQLKSNGSLEEFERIVKYMKGEVS